MRIRNGIFSTKVNITFVLTDFSVQEEDNHHFHSFIRRVFQNSRENLTDDYVMETSVIYDESPMLKISLNNVYFQHQNVFHT